MVMLRIAYFKFWFVFQNLLPVYTPAIVCEVFPCPRHPLTQGTITLLNLLPVCTLCLSMLYFKKKAMDFFSFHFGAHLNILISQQVFSKHPKCDIVIWSFVSQNSLELGLSWVMTAQVGWDPCLRVRGARLCENKTEAKLIFFLWERRDAICPPYAKIHFSIYLSFYPL